MSDRSSLMRPWQLRTNDEMAAEDTTGKVREALEVDKAEGLRLAVRARMVALGVITVLVLILNPGWSALYYLVLLGGFALLGLAQLRVGVVGRSSSELLLVFCDLALMTFTLVVPNPLGSHEWPAAVQFHISGFEYFFVLLAASTLAYSWRTTVAIGTWTTVLWMIAVGIVYFFSDATGDVRSRLAEALGGNDDLAATLDPHNVLFGLRLQEVVVFLIVAGVLALAKQRSNRLLLRQVASERERTNLARYFSPNMVEQLAGSDEPLREVRTQDISVLFVDIRDFTNFAERNSPETVIDTLRTFHRRMERQVFAHEGTLDKYLGDGLMATFGTPSQGAHDALNALRCARAMAQDIAAWNEERAAAGLETIEAGFGLHHGSALLGDIGDNRLEFTVIGSTVNTASRLEALTRDLDAAVVVSAALVDRAKAESDFAPDDLDGLIAHTPVPVRGLSTPVSVYTMPRA